MIIAGWGKNASLEIFGVLWYDRYSEKHRNSNIRRKDRGRVPPLSFIPASNEENIHVYFTWILKPIF
jgi:hypothetical protein